MAVKEHVTVEYIDDITGDAGEDVKMYTVGFDDTWYQIDMSDKTAGKLLEKFRDAVLEKGRVADEQDRFPKKRRGAGSNAPQRTAAEYAALREWAASNGMNLSPKGRIPKSAWDAYEAAQG